MVVSARRGVGRDGGLAAAVRRDRRHRRGDRRSAPGRSAPGLARRRDRSRRTGDRARPRLAVRTARRPCGRRVRADPDPRALGDDDPPAAALPRPGGDPPTVPRRGDDAALAAGRPRPAHPGDGPRRMVELCRTGLGWLLGVGPGRERLVRPLAGVDRRAPRRTGTSWLARPAAVRRRPRRCGGVSLGCRPVRPRLRRGRHDRDRARPRRRCARDLAARRDRRRAAPDRSANGRRRSGGSCRRSSPVACWSRSGC